MSDGNNENKKNSSAVREREMCEAIGPIIDHTGP